jgi:hypothetical protein
VVEHLPSLHKALDSIPNAAKEESEESTGLKLMTMILYMATPLSEKPFPAQGSPCDTQYT